MTIDGQKIWPRFFFENAIPFYYRNALKLLSPELQSKENYAVLFRRSGQVKSYLNFVEYSSEMSAMFPAKIVWKAFIILGRAFHEEKDWSAKNHTSQMRHAWNFIFFQNEFNSSFS